MTANAPLLRSSGARTSLPLREDAGCEDTLDTAFALGWDHARHGVTPSLETLCAHLRLQQGFRAGRSCFGRRTQPAGVHVRAWLELRLHALRRRITFETVQLTPHFLARIDVACCPVTREPLGEPLGPEGGRRLVRLRGDAGFAAGHVVVTGARAAQARGELGLTALLQRQRTCETEAKVLDGLDAAQWARWSTLCSLVEPMPHARAAGLPLCVLPPNRLRLFNPVQALQTLLSRALLHRTPNRRLAALRERLPAQSLPAFDAWLTSYQARVAALLPQQPDEAPYRALEDAWQAREVLARWRRFATRLDADRCERIVLECGEGRVRWLPDAAATDGWALEQGGVRAAVTARPGRSGGQRRQLGLFDRAA
ncbi:hypothetical protein [Caldimonas tepidiphila]|uniref:hypothetical protein n=1 Tax=Caldimonas tepidiphila TaxID=2315841 RepID=UPI000E5ADCEA|nr:hypothetical protein [Caldimonas tepidiphila]